MVLITLLVTISDTLSLTVYAQATTPTNNLRLSEFIDNSRKNWGRDAKFVQRNCFN